MRNEELRWEGEYKGILYYVVFALEPFRCVEAFEILTDHELLVFFMSYFLHAVSVQGVVKFSWIVDLNMKSFKSVEVWRPMIAGPSISVTQKDTLVLSLL